MSQAVARWISSMGPSSRTSAQPMSSSMVALRRFASTWKSRHSRHIHGCPTVSLPATRTNSTLAIAEMLPAGAA